MLVRSILASYSRLLAGVTLALLAIALAGCNDTVAEKATPGGRCWSPGALRAAIARSAVSSAPSSPGSRPTWASGCPARSPKRLVEVGQTVDVGQPLATLDEVDLKLQAEQAEAEFRAATGVLAQAAAAEQPRQGFARQGLGHRRAAGSGQGRRRRGPRAAQSRRALGRTHQELVFPTRRWSPTPAASSPRP